MGGELSGVDLVGIGASEGVLGARRASGLLVGATVGTDDPHPPPLPFHDGDPPLPLLVLDGFALGFGLGLSICTILGFCAGFFGLGLGLLPPPPPPLQLPPFQVLPHPVGPGVGFVVGLGVGGALGDDVGEEVGGGVR